MPLPPTLPAAVSSNASSPPETLAQQSAEVLANRYLCQRTLGSGNCGTALLVIDRKERDPNNKQKVVKKVFVGNLHPDETVDASQEAGLLRNLDHPGIVHFYDSFIDKEFFCIVTEFCDSGDLDNKIVEYTKAQKKFTEAQIVDWTTQLLLALQYMHSRKVLHRDLKTRNIFLRGNMVKIGDFGISRILKSNSEMATTFVGTPYYMSPEVLKHDGYNSKSDIWSVGCIVYELATLRHAFEGTTLMGVMYKIVEVEAPKWPDAYSTALADLYYAMVEKNADKRPSASDALMYPVIAQQLQILKNTMIEKHKKVSQTAVVTEDIEKLANAAKQVSKMDELKKESEHKFIRNLPPRDRLRLKKQQQADEEAKRIASNMRLQIHENQAQYNRAKQQNNPYESTIAIGKEQRHAVAASRPVQHVKPATLPQPKLQSQSVDESSSESDDEVMTTIVSASSPAVKTQHLHETPSPRRYSADDRPITPMRNPMLYSMMLEAPQFPDGIPDDPDLAETLYEQDEFISDSDGDEETMCTNLQNVLFDGTLTEHTLVADDKDAGAFGPGARDLKIKNLRKDLQLKLGTEKLEKAYSYLKRERFDDRRPGTEINEATILHDLSKIVPDADDRFEVEHLLFLEMQINH